MAPTLNYLKYRDELNEYDLKLIKHLTSNGIVVNVFSINQIETRNEIFGEIVKKQKFNPVHLTYISNYLGDIKGVDTANVIATPFILQFGVFSHNLTGYYLGTSRAYEFAFGLPEEDNLKRGDHNLLCYANNPSNEEEIHKFLLALINLSNGKTPTFPKRDELIGKPYQEVKKQLQLENLL